MGIRHLRGREYIHSPDRLYDEKLSLVQQTISQYQAGQQEVYFMDQLTIYLHPSVACDWSEVQPLSRQGHLSNKTFRICGALNCFNGEVHTLMRNKISIPSLVEFFEQLCRKHPGKTIFLILDNWTVHWHPDVRAVLEPQLYPYQMTLPKSWQKLKPRKKYIGRNLPLQLVYLPTYASWLNPIEKTWRWLKQDFLHHHCKKDNMEGLKNSVRAWFQSPEHTAQQMLGYVGLKNPEGIYAQALINANPYIFKERFNF